jgi:hypothetical protein
MLKDILYEVLCIILETILVFLFANFAFQAFYIDIYTTPSQCLVVTLLANSLYYIKEK